VYLDFLNFSFPFLFKRNLRRFQFSYMQLFTIIEKGIIFNIVPKPKQMLRFLFAITLLSLFSCSVPKAGGSLSDEDGYIYYEQPAPHLRMQLYGDYKFHSLKRKHFTDVNKSFLKYTTAKVNRITPQLMYAAHTFVKPFYSSIGVVYKGAQANKNLITNVQQQLQNRYSTSFSAVDSFYTSLGTAHYFGYTVSNSTAGTTYHREYFINNGQDLVRFYFWAPSDTAMVFREAEVILKNIR